MNLTVLIQKTNKIYINCYFCFNYFFLKELYRGSWVAQSVKYLTLGFGSSYDFMDPETEPYFRVHPQQGVTLKILSIHPRLFSLSLFLKK